MDEILGIKSNGPRIGRVTSVAFQRRFRFWVMILIDGITSWMETE